MVDIPATRGLSVRSSGQDSRGSCNVTRALRPRKRSPAKDDGRKTTDLFKSCRSSSNPSAISASMCMDMTPRALRAKRRQHLVDDGECRDILSLPALKDTDVAYQVKRRQADSPTEEVTDVPNRKRPFSLSLGQTNLIGCAGDSPSSGVGTPPLSPTMMHPWIQMFLSWTNEQKSFALDELIGRCEPGQVRHILAMIEPQFKRDFITFLPKEVSLRILSHLSASDLIHCSQVCTSWRSLCNDPLLWKLKCQEYGIKDTSSVKKRRRSNIPFRSNSWKMAFFIKYRIEYNWRRAELRPKKVLKGHDDHVITCLQFSGNRIVSGSDDNTLKVWSVASGKCLRTLHGHTGGVWCSQFVNNTVISGSTDRTLKIWNAETGACLHTLVGHTSTVRCLAMADNRVVSGSRDATLRVWDIHSGECVFTLNGHVAAVRCVQYNGNYIVSGSYDCTVRVWIAETGECFHVLQGHNNRVYSLQFDGVHIVSGSLDTSIRVWDAFAGTCLHTLWGHQSLTSGMELSGDILVSGNADSTVKVWNIVSGQCLHTFHGQKGHQSAVTSLQFNEKFAITSSDDGTVKLWDMQTGEFVRDLVSLWSARSGGVVWRVCCNDRKLVCAVGSRNGTEDTKLLVLDFDHM
ncbi:F-box/WD repeat-containing protein 7-like isoform X2 [Sycon ciliatum]|uniref:F-box/WD repeat-containing protein 7-like isoform X2 n=1 Tax=Sycon ciliatum TaxID=27933 RepID=UPI0031F672AA